MDSYTKTHFTYLPYTYHYTPSACHPEPKRQWGINPPIPPSIRPSVCPSISRSCPFVVLVPDLAHSYKVVNRWGTPYLRSPSIRAAVLVDCRIFPSSSILSHYHSLFLALCIIPFSNPGPTLRERERESFVLCRPIHSSKAWIRYLCIYACILDSFSIFLPIPISYQALALQPIPYETHLVSCLCVTGSVLVLVSTPDATASPFNKILGCPPPLPPISSNSRSSSLSLRSSSSSASLNTNRYAMRKIW